MLRETGRNIPQGRLKSALVPIILIVFLDILGMTIMIPVLAPIFLDKSTTILAADVSSSTRTILLGFLLSSYPLAQFFGAPIFGALSDKYGRKKILFLSMAGSLIGYVMFSTGLIFGSLAILFASRLIDGFTGGNISVALSAIADVSNKNSKTKNFGLVGAAYGAGLILGPVIGGVLSNSNLVSWFSHSTPFLFAAILTFANMLLLIKFFPETLKKRIETPLSFFAGFRNIRKAFRMPNLRTMFSVVFLIMLGFAFFIYFLPVFLIEKFNYNESLIGYLLAYLGMWIVLTQIFIIRPVSRRYSAEKILRTSLIALAISLFLITMPKKSITLYFIAPLTAIFTGLTMPSYNAIISNLGREDSQGEILGINQSMQSLAQAIPPVIAGFVVAVHAELPTLIAAAATFLAWALFVVFFSNSHGKKFHEV
ncbi:MFS transporter [Candidatus Pacearchaeota archaeon]|nr:MFS transporter [Candidatus Pacearchaeota archaeon]